MPAVAVAIAAAILSSSSALAGDNCNQGTTVTTNCTNSYMDAGYNPTVTINPGVTVSSDNGVNTYGAVAAAILNDILTGSLTNKGTITQTFAGNNYALLATGGSYNDLVLNNGTISNFSANNGQYGAGITVIKNVPGFGHPAGTVTLNTLVNTGSITSANSFGVYVASDGVIGTFTNSGSITGGLGSIYNGGAITTLSNGQASLTLNGQLPTSYNVIVNGATYGKLSASGIGVSTTTFGIFGGDVAHGVAASSLLKNTTYTAVLTGFTAGNLTGATTGTYGGVPWSLVEEGATTTWDLKTTGQSIVTGGLTGSQAGVASSINVFINNGGTLPNGFNTLLNLSGPTLSNALQQISGQPGASAPQSSFTSTNSFFNTLFGTGIGGGTPGLSNGGQAIGYASEAKRPRSAEEAYAAVTPHEAAAIFDRRWNVWATGYGGSTIVDGDANAGTNKTTSNVYGAMVGADYGLSPLTRLGFSLGGAGSNFGVANGMGGGKADVFNAAVYGKQLLGPAYIAVALGYAWQGVTTDRTVTVAGTDQLHASFDANALTGRIESGWKVQTSILSLTPYGAIQSTTFWLPGYNETAASGSSQFALSYAAQTVTSTRGELGLYWEKVLPVVTGEITFGAKTAWAHDWHATSMATANATFQSLPGAPAFTVNGASPAQDFALISAGAQMAWRNGWAVSASFDSELANSTHSYGGKGTVRYAFN